MGWLDRILRRAGGESDEQLDALMREAYAAHRDGDSERAASLYRRILERRPGHGDALYLLGELASDAGRHEEAIALLRRASEVNPGEAAFHEKLAHALERSGQADAAIASYRAALAIDPRNAQAANNLGCLLSAQGDVAAACASFEAALREDPGLVQARYNLGNLLRDQGQAAPAVEHYRAALAVESGHARIWNNLGCALQSLGRVAEAAQAFGQAIGIDPAYGIAHKNLGNALRELGALEQARGSYEQALRLMPGDAEVAHYLNAVRHETPDRAPAEYVTRMFDAFAAKFDDTLVNTLRYRTPQLLLDAVQRARPAPQAPMSVLDLGCGTGLFGECVRKLSRRITGVDLSPEMIERARQRACYDELLVRDLLDYLAQATQQSFDLAAAVDVFVYLGDLAAVFHRTHGLLRPGGLFAYSVEANLLSERDFELMPTGRYCHSRRYLMRLAAQSGFVERSSSLEALREEKGQPVRGYVCVLQRA